jgi:hypothetical protein
MSRVRSFLSIAATGTACLGLGGCFVDAPADDSADDPALSADGFRSGLVADDEPAIVHGTYRVPVPDDLAPFAIYEVADATVDVSGGVLQVSFVIPEGLLGFPAAASFAGAAQPGVGDVAVGGPQGHGTCRVDGTIECALQYYAVSADLEAVSAYWRARGDAFVDARIQVASLFDDDPLGVLRLSVE